MKCMNTLYETVVSCKSQLVTEYLLLPQFCYGILSSFVIQDNQDTTQDTYSRYYSSFVIVQFWLTLILRRIKRSFHIQLFCMEEKG